MICGDAVGSVRETIFIIGQCKIDQVEGLTKSMIAKLSEGGFERAEDILDAGVEGLKGVKGIGVKSAEKILSAIGVYFEEVE